MTTTLPLWVAWPAILLCASQSALFSGLNLAFFGVSRLRLEVEAATGDASASRVLALRENPNRLLTTILWGNVAVNVLLAMLTNSVMTPIVAFFVSTFVITIFGEIVPQAYFSRHAKRMASLLSPILRFYGILLAPVTVPSTKVLDWWLGHEEIAYFRESVLEELLRRHATAREAGDVGRMEGLGAANFLALDDLAMAEEGEPIDPRSVLKIEFEDGAPRFPEFTEHPADPWLAQVGASGKKWVVLVDQADRPRLVLDADGFLRRTLMEPGLVDPLEFCHLPILVDDPGSPLGRAMLQLEVDATEAEDDVIDRDLILLWGDERRVITGADILGRLLRGTLGRSSPPVGGDPLPAS